MQKDLGRGADHTLIQVPAIGPPLGVGKRDVGVQIDLALPAGDVARQRENFKLAFKDVLKVLLFGYAIESGADSSRRAQPGK